MKIRLLIAALLYPQWDGKCVDGFVSGPGEGEFLDNAPHGRGGPGVHEACP